MFVPPHETFFNQKFLVVRVPFPSIFFFQFKEGQDFSKSYFQIKQGQIIGARTKVMILPTYIKTRKTKSEQLHLSNKMYEM